MRRRMLVFAALLGISGAGCEDSPPFHTAAHTALPVIDGHDRIVLASPQLVTITFPGYTYQNQVEAFGDFIGSSAWLHTSGAEYGVGPATHRQKLVWPTAAPARYTDQDLRKLLSSAIADGDLPAPTPGANDLVFLVYAPSTSILDASSAGAGVLCQKGSFHSAGGLFTAGYHESLLAPDGTRVPYVVVGDCSAELDEITAIASRELIGALTDPYEVEGSGYLFDTTPADPWLINLDSGEVGYFCAGEHARAEERGWVLHRAWSNAAATAGHQPCVPVPAADVYFNVSAQPATIVTAAPGSTLSFTLTGWSTAPTAAWPLVLADADGVDIKGEALHARLSRATINNAEVVTLTMTVPATARSGQYGGMNVLSGPDAHIWPIAFTVQ